MKNNYKLYKASDKFPSGVGIYGIYFSSNKKRTYVGSTGNFKLRWQAHLQTLATGSHSNIKIRYSCDKYGIDDIRFYVLEICDLEFLDDREQFWINHFDSYKTGLNCRPEAKSNRGLKLSQNTKDKIAKTHFKKTLDKYEQKVLNLYKTKSLTIREMSGKLGLGRRAISKILKHNGIDIPKGNCGAANKRKVYQYTSEGVFISVFDNTRQASIALHISASLIKKVCVGEYRHAGGFVWAFKKLTKYQVLNIYNKPKSIVVPKWTKKRRRNQSIRLSGKLKGHKYSDIHQYDLNGSLIKIFQTASHIVAELGFNQSHLRRALKNPPHLYKNFFWKNGKSNDDQNI